MVASAQVASSTAADAPLEQCIVDAVQSWSFPEPPGGDTVTVNQPFVLSFQ